MRRVTVPLRRQGVSGPCNWHREPTLDQAQIPLCRLPRDVRDKPVTSSLAQIPLRRLPRNFEVGVVGFGLKGTSRGSRHSGIWTSPSVERRVVGTTSVMDVGRAKIPRHLPTWSDSASYDGARLCRLSNINGINIEMTVDGTVYGNCTCIIGLHV